MAHMTLLETSKIIAEKDKLVDTLKSGVVHVIFTKTDGSTRFMDCTLDDKIIPPKIVDPNKLVKPRAINPDIVNVYDVVANDWRSFRLDTLKFWISKQ